MVPNSPLTTPLLFPIFWKKVATGIVRESRTFLGHPIWGALRGHLCDSTAFLLFMFLNLHHTVKLLIEAPSVPGFY